METRVGPIGHDIPVPRTRGEAAEAALGAILGWRKATGDLAHCAPCLQYDHAEAECQNSGGCEGCGDCVRQDTELWPVAAALRHYYLLAGKLPFPIEADKEGEK